MRPRSNRVRWIVGLAIPTLAWIAIAGPSPQGPWLGRVPDVDSPAAPVGASPPAAALGAWLAPLAARVADLVMPDWDASEPDEHEPVVLSARSATADPSSPEPRSVVVFQGGGLVDLDSAAADAEANGVGGGAVGASSASNPNDPPLASSASATYSDQFSACRSGAQGGGYDPDSGLWAWTCGNYNWHAALDPSQATAVRSVDCTGLRTPDEACRRAGERLLIGVLHAAGVAADFTVPGGTVFWPLFAGKDHGLYVDRGAGVLADGTTRAKIPPAEQLDVKALIGAARYAATGPSARRHAIQALNVRHVGEVPGSFELDGAGMPRRRGVWYVPDKGPHPDGNPLTGADIEDGPGQSIEPATAALMVGSQRSFSSFNDLNFCDDAGPTDPRCQRTTSGDAFAGRVHWEYGAMSRLVALNQGTGANMCLSNLVGEDEASTTGTCPGDRRMRCWATGATTLRSQGGCVWDTDGSGSASPADFDLSEGVGCQGFVDALEYDAETKGRQLEVAVVFDNCIDAPQVFGDCSSEMGNHLRRASIHDFISGPCGQDARALFVGTGSSQGFVPRTTVPETLVPAELAITVASTAGLSVGQTIRIDAELMRIGSISGSVLVVERGIGGTLRTNHAYGASLFTTITANNTTTVWPPNYRVSGQERIVALSAARLLQSPAGFENVSIMPSDPFGSAACPTGSETACDGTIGIAFNSGSGFYRNGTVLSPTFTGTNATFFDGSNLSEQVLVEDLRVYGPTRIGPTFDLADNWTLRRAVVEGGDPSTLVSPISTFGDRITIEDSVFRNITTATLLRFGLVGPQRGLILRNNRFIGNGGGGDALINIGTASDFLIEGNEFIGNAGVVPIRLSPFRSLNATTTKTYLRDGTIRHNVFSGNELLANGGEDAFSGNVPDVAKAAILIRDDESVVNDQNEISGLAIHDNRMIATVGPAHDGGTVAHQNHACLVWLEQDDEPFSLMEESWPQIEIHSNSLDAGFGSRVVCAGDTDPGYRNASHSIDLFANAYRPITWGNTVNGETEPGTRFLGALDFAIEAPASGDSFLLTRMSDDVIPVGFDCIASGGSGLAEVDVSVGLCDGDGANCLLVGELALTATDTNFSTTAFLEPALRSGSWIEVAVANVAWSVPGRVTCALAHTR